MLTTGGLLVAIALLALALVAPVFRGSSPPSWATRGWVGEVVTLAIVCTLAIGLGYLGAGVIGTVQKGPDYLDFGLLAVVLSISVVIWRRLSARARPKAVEADASEGARAPAPAPAHGGGTATAEPVPVGPGDPASPPKAA